MASPRRAMTASGGGGLLLALVVGYASPPERQAYARLQAAEPRPSLAATNPAATAPEKPVLTERSTLDDYLRYAALNNAELEAAFNRWKAELEKVPQVRALPDPRFSYGYFIQSVETRTGPQHQRFELAQTFPWLGKLRLRGEAALAAADAAQQQYEAAKLRLFYRVKDAFYEYCYLGRAIAVARENLELLRQVEKVARTKYEAGTALYADVLKAQAELDKLDDQLHSLRDLRGPILAKLNAALNRPFNAALPWPKSVPVVKMAVDETQLVATLAQSNPELRGLEAVAVTLTGYPTRKIDGVVDFIYPYLENKTRTTTVRVVLPNPDGLLRPGMYANAELQHDLGKQLLVPAEAAWQPYLIVAEFGAIFILCGISFLAIQLIVSIRNRAVLLDGCNPPSATSF
jgi:multidrug efflux pump subunit AcrA (membrane-fusion protein)